MGVVRRTKALVQRTMLRVDRHEFCTINLTQRLHYGPSGDQTFFVGKSKSTSVRQCCHGDRKTSKTHDPVDDDVSNVAHLCRICHNLNLAQPRKCFAHFVSRCGVSYRDNRWPKGLGLLDNGRR